MGSSMGYYFVIWGLFLADLSSDCWIDELLFIGAICSSSLLYTCLLSFSFYGTFVVDFMLFEHFFLEDFLFERSSFLDAILFCDRVETLGIIERRFAGFGVSVYFEIIGWSSHTIKDPTPTSLTSFSSSCLLAFLSQLSVVVVVFLTKLSA